MAYIFLLIWSARMTLYLHAYPSLSIYPFVYSYWNKTIVTISMDSITLQHFSKTYHFKCVPAELRFNLISLDRHRKSFRSRWIGYNGRILSANKFNSNRGRAEEEASNKHNEIDWRSHTQHDNSLSIIVFWRLVLVIIISRPTVTFIDLGHGCYDTQFRPHIGDIVSPSFSFDLQLERSPIQLDREETFTHLTKK